jgi:hypothetical protein
MSPSRIDPSCRPIATQGAPVRQLCGARPHDRHHDGEFDIIRTSEGNLHFVARDGRLIGKVTGGKWKRPKKRAGP